MTHSRWTDIDQGRPPLQGRYTLVERLGSSGPASVWRAIDREADRQVVVKSLPIADAP
ncbi:MAG: hypothetical protein ABEN55_12630, partial [Bradymonadaceae bacterium]